MIHEHIPEPGTNELYEERGYAAQNIGMAALYLCNVTAEYYEARDNGTMTDELRTAADAAGREYNHAIDWLLEANRRIHEAERD